ncbi:hypothetical protein [Hamadaea tsunoensis]|uniref:hypothetical protein n=1 Tax=Hamadaea tsunoensis TaxID=53368 RepID=UPI0004266334|nr:hypothetical protein [Hamadaea tsunoensis]
MPTTTTPAMDPADAAPVSTTVDQMTAEADAQQPEHTQLDMDLIADLLKHAGIEAFTLNSGGGCAVIYIGHEIPHPIEEGYTAYELLAGPGWFEKDNDDRWRTYGSTAEFYISPDDYGTSPGWDCPPGVSEAYVSAYIIHTITQIRAQQSA